MPNNPNAIDNLKPFVKGDDPRRNLNGRPKGFDIMRELARMIADEQVTSKDGTTSMQRAELILRSWAGSNNWQLQRAFMEIAYGKVPDNVHISGEDGEPIEGILRIIEHGKPT